MKNNKIEFRVTDELKDKVNKKAESEGLTVSAWLTRLVTLETNNNEQKETTTINH